MRRFFGWCAALALAPLLLIEPAPAAETKPTPYGKSKAYDIVAKLPLMHSGRIKPIDTVAREEVKLIYSRETIKLTDEDGKVTATWTPVAAFLDWSARPEFWDDQKFILVEYLPLKQVLLAENIKVALKAIADKPETSPSAKQALLELAKKDTISHHDLRGLLTANPLPDADGKMLARFAGRLGEEQKWLSPNELEKSVVKVDGHTHSFNEWIGEISEKGQGAGPMMGGKPKLSELERKAFDVGSNYFRYRVHRDGQVLSQLQILGMPRPYHEDNQSYLKFYQAAIEKYQQGGRSALSPLEMDGIATVSKFLENLPVKDHDEVGGSNAEFNQKFKLWLRDKAAWVPLPIVLKEKTDGLQAAGFPVDKVEAFRKAFQGFEASERDKPGEASEDAANTLITAARNLGVALNPSNYPNEAAMTREAHFNGFAPFYLCQFAYGSGLVILLSSLMVGGLGVALGRERSFQTLARLVYFVGIAAFLGGILLEVYGFWLRVSISGWAPVTNMYETVIWVALVTAVIGLALEGIYRKTYAALAATGVAFVTTLLAYNSGSILDPNIKALQPVLRSNLWLTIHVLTIVSSYAAFALALGLGVIASLYYLTATYKKSPSLLRVLSPVIFGVPLTALGYVGIQGAYGEIDLGKTVLEYGFYPSTGIFAVGLVIASMAVFGFIGEIISRLIFQDEESLDEAAIVGEQRADALVASANQGASWESKSYQAEAGGAGGVATAVRSSTSVLAEIRARQASHRPKQTARDRAMQETALRIKPLSNFIYRSMQVGVLLVAAGTILGGVWADYSWGRFWGWDPKEVWALITLLVYLVPLHGRFAGWINTSSLVFSSVICFMSVLMAWYGVNYVLGVGLHSYGFGEGGSQGMVSVAALITVGFGAAAVWRRHLGMSETAALPA